MVLIELFCSLPVTPPPAQPPRAQHDGWSVRRTVSFRSDARAAIVRSMHLAGYCKSTLGNHLP